MSMPSSTATPQGEHSPADPRRAPLTDKLDWRTSALNGMHLWKDTDESGCQYQAASEHGDCKKSGNRKRCSACKLVVHQKCIEHIDPTNQLKCQLTFREANQNSIQQLPSHHIVLRRKHDGKCDTCGKNFESKLSFKTAKEQTAVTCSWCKRAYHSKAECNKLLLEDFCDMGRHKPLIVPPSWIVKLPPRKFSQTSCKRGRGSHRVSSRDRRAFLIKPPLLPSGGCCMTDSVPLCLFVNPKSGGNQGVRILEKFQFLLNPRQVFDLCQGGPRFGLDLYRKVPNLRVLVCGGDGTVGWVLSEIDRLKITPPPPVCILPLGTGNDLSRFLGWGSGYTDEPLSKILTHVEEGEIQKLDRWDLEVRSNQTNEDPEQTEEVSVAKLPQSVMNNYFSIGADADVCLEFHESREANPHRFNSRLKNLMFYGKAGGQAVVKRKSKDLYKCIDQLMCDGHDLTQRLKELKPLCLIFLNISSYSAGTSPWGNPVNNDEFLPQSCDDGYLEVIGLSSKTMVTTQVGLHGARIYQCKQALLLTNKNISMQVDGEPCRLRPSRIHIKNRNQSVMVAKAKHNHSSFVSTPAYDTQMSMEPQMMSINVFYLSFAQYDSLVRFDIDEVNSLATPIGTLQLNSEERLDELRRRLTAMQADKQLEKISDEWTFLDAKWTHRIYRIDEAQEYLMYLGDIMEGGAIYLLDRVKKSELTINMSSRDSLGAASGTSSGVGGQPSKSQPSSPSMCTLQRPILHRPLSVPNFVPIEPLSGSLDDDLDDSTDALLPHFDTLSSIEDSDSNLSGSEESLDSQVLCANPTTTTIIPSCTVDESHTESDVVTADEVEQIKLYVDAARQGNLPQLQSLHEAGMKLTSVDDIGRTALHVAAKHGKKNIIKYIVDNVHSMVLDLVDENHGHTALHKAAYHKQRTICRMLISKGASLARLDLEGNTPRLLAMRAGDTDLAKFLENQERLQMIAADDYETVV